MGIVYAGLGLVLVVWGISYMKDGLLDPVTATITALFPTMNDILALFLTWLAVIVLCLLVAMVIVALFKSGGDVDNG